MVVLRLTEDQLELLQEAMLIAEESGQLVYVGDDVRDAEWQSMCDNVDKLTQEINDNHSTV